MPDGFESELPDPRDLPGISPEVSRLDPIDSLINGHRLFIQILDERLRIVGVIYIDGVNQEPVYAPLSSASPLHLDLEHKNGEDPLVAECFELISKGEVFMLERYLDFVPAAATSTTGTSLLSHAISYANENIFWLLRSKGAKASVQNWKTAFMNMPNPEILEEIEKDLTSDELIEACEYEFKKTSPRETPRKTDPDAELRRETMRRFADSQTQREAMVRSIQYYGT